MRLSNRSFHSIRQTIYYGSSIYILLAGYSSAGYRAGYGGGITYDYGYYKSHHGFAIVNNRFTYGGIGKQIWNCQYIWCVIKVITPEDETIQYHHCLC